MSETKKREWTVPEDLADLLAAGIYERVSRELVQEAHFEHEVITRRVGGVIKTAPFRAKVRGQWLVVGYQCQWESFVPGMTIDVDEPEVSDPAPDLADEAEPVLN